MIAALLIGTLLAVGALAFVLYPVFFDVPGPVKRSRVVPRQSEREAAVSALREIDFDRATGKLSDVDYSELKAQYTDQAVRAMRAEASGADGVSGATGVGVEDDAIEFAVRAYRSTHAACPTCGPRPEPDAEFCGNCGRYLHDRCADCGAPVEAHDARYCVKCGNRFAA